MARDVRTIRIESILGGESQFRFLYSPDQFQSSYAIDPDMPVGDTGVDTRKASGFLRPTASGIIGTTSLTNNDGFYWIVDSPRTTRTFLYDGNGSAYTTDGTDLVFLGDVADGVVNQPGGCEYYNNYIYFSRDTTIARYGPLDGESVFTQDYWCGVLGKTQLSTDTYPLAGLGAGGRMPSHVLKSHTDGKLYICDVVGGQGTLHYIKTTRGTYDGDTDAGSTYDALDLPPGCLPIDLESYGDDLVIGTYEGGVTGNTHGSNSQIFFWDTVSDSPSFVIDSELPVQSRLTALLNGNGILHVFMNVRDGCLVLRYLGGSTFEQLALVSASAPIPGGVASSLNRVYFASSAEEGPVVRAFGSKTSGPVGVFSVVGAENPTSASTLALNLRRMPGTGAPDLLVPIFSTFYESLNDPTLQVQNVEYENVSASWKSQFYKIGQPFKITKIRIPLANGVVDGARFTVSVGIDGTSNETTVDEINYEKYPNKKRVTLRPENLTGDNMFYLGIEWSGSQLCTLALPITIEYELIDD